MDHVPHDPMGESSNVAATKLTVSFGVCCALPDPAVRCLFYPTPESVLPSSALALLTERPMGAMKNATLLTWFSPKVSFVIAALAETEGVMARGSMLTRIRNIHGFLRCSHALDGGAGRRWLARRGTARRALIAASMLSSFARRVPFQIQNPLFQRPVWTLGSRGRFPPVLPPP